MYLLYVRGYCFYIKIRSYDQDCVRTEWNNNNKTLFFGKYSHAVLSGINTMLHHTNEYHKRLLKLR